MCIYCDPASPYKVPDDYNPNINFKNYDRGLARRIHQTCKILIFYDNYFLSNEQISGFNWYHLPTRLWFSLNGSTNQENDNVVRKIEDAFRFILNIKTDLPLEVNSEIEEFYNTIFTVSLAGGYLYTDLAEKVIQKFEKTDYPELFELAHRIIHERIRSQCINL